MVESHARHVIDAMRKRKELKISPLSETYISFLIPWVNYFGIRDKKQGTPTAPKYEIN
jgi:hypothetical protein